MAKIKRITPCLWFDSEAEEAAKYYCSIFKNSRINTISHYGKEGYEIHKQPEGKVLTVHFELDDNPFVALNGGPDFKFSEAISFTIYCDTQEELDEYWEKLSKGGDPKAQQCGWLKDKYGLSWQIVPTIMEKMMAAENEHSEKVMKAMMKMKKLEIDKLEEAFNGVTV
jgi:predicted 3-demethylubiquinone-9 3-methyltransferase (glyoxalase superfamily)